MSLTLRVSLHRAELTFTDIQALTGSRRCFRLQLQPLRAPPSPSLPSSRPQPGSLSGHLDRGGAVLCNP